MSAQIAVPRPSTIEASPDECGHGMVPAYCHACKHQRQGGRRIQLQADGYHCYGCDAYLHKGDLATIVDDHQYCPNCRS